MGEDPLHPGRAPTRRRSSWVEWVLSHLGRGPSSAPTLSEPTRGLKSTSAPSEPDADFFGLPREHSETSYQRATSAVSVGRSSEWGNREWRGCKPVQRLGRGTQGEVWLVTTAEGHRAVDKSIDIAKLCDDSGERSTIGATEPDLVMRSRVEKEVELLRSLNHRHVVALYDAWIEDDLSSMHLVAHLVETCRPQRAATFGRGLGPNGPPSAAARFEPR